MKCKCCGNPISLVGDFTKIYRCGSCLHVYCHYVINEHEFYQKYRDHNPLFPSNIRKLFVSNIMKIIKPYINIGDKILEVGPGDGHLAKEIQKCINGKVDCCELDKNLAKKLKDYELGEIYDCHLLELSDDLSYDTLIAFDILEHIDDIESFAKKYSKIAKRLIVQVPVKRAITQKEKFCGHYHYFTKESITNLFKEYYDVTMMIEDTGRHHVSGKWSMMVVFDRK